MFRLFLDNFRCISLNIQHPPSIQMCSLCACALGYKSIGIWHSTIGNSQLTLTLTLNNWQSSTPPQWSLPPPLPLDFTMGARTWRHPRAACIHEQGCQRVCGNGEDLRGGVEDCQLSTSMSTFIVNVNAHCFGIFRIGGVSFCSFRLEWFYFYFLKII